MPRQHKIPNLEAIAQSLGVTTRTVRRYHAKGANVASLDSVAAHILSQRAPKTDALKAILKRYEIESKIANRPN
jgi:predicted transcriptional regulator